MRESGARNTKRAPTRLTPPSRRWVRLSAHYRTSDHDFFRWVLFRSARVSRPRRMADRKLGSFASVISQLFVLSHNPQTTNTRSVWLRSGAFLSPPVPLPSASLTTGHYPLAPRLTLHAPRSTPPGPSSAGTSGVRSCADAPPLATACHRPPNYQRPNGTRSRRAAPLYSVCHRTRRFLRKNQWILPRSPPLTR